MFTIFLIIFSQNRCIDVCVTYVLNDKNVDETVDEGSGQELLSNDYSNYDDLESDFRKREVILKEFNKNTKSKIFYYSL